MARSDSTSRDAGDPRVLGEDGILLVAGEGLLTTYPLRKAEIVVGRDQGCDVPVAHRSLSRRHAVVRAGPPLTVQDLGSTNGTRVRGELLRGGEPSVLDVGDAFHIGNLSFLLLRAPRTPTQSTRNDGEAIRIQDPTAESPSELVRDVARSGVNLLLLGETGVGKEVLAQTLHRCSGRKGELVRINCAALSSSLVESELFGHERGAFTGASHSRAGLLEAANGGTAFLDEVGELPEAMQAKLLRAIENKEVTRVGSVRPIAIDVRFLAATNRHLPDEVAAGRFRADLYFRLDGLTLSIPPLRERRARIGPLALQLFREAQAAAHGASPLVLDVDVIPYLEAYDFPGNVRELKSIAQRAVLLSRGGPIGTRHIVRTAKAPSAAQSLAAPAREEGRPAEPRGGRQSLQTEEGASLAQGAGGPTPTSVLSESEERERARIVLALEARAGNQTRAAKDLGMSRATLVTRLDVLRIPRPRK